MINVGVIGLGMMGSTHLDVYAKRQDVRVVAVADLDEDRLHGRSKAQGNVEGQAQGGFDLSAVKKYREGKDLIKDRQVEVVDVCLPTPLHLEYARAALRAGKHVLVEKPLARTYRDAKKLVAAGEKARGFAMPAMCMRFWPGWEFLKSAIDDKRFGKVLAAHFRRVASHPGGPFYSNGELCGGALLDLHVHDIDFIQHCFGVPESVTSVGYSKITGQPDHVVTQYHYKDIPLVVAEGGWAMAPGFGFSMTYTVNFENATVTFSFDGKDHVKVFQPGKDPVDVDLPQQLGYEREIEYFLGCVVTSVAPQRVTLRDAANSVAIAEAEAKSIATGKSAKVKL